MVFSQGHNLFLENFKEVHRVQGLLTVTYDIQNGSHKSPLLCSWDIKPKIVRFRSVVQLILQRLESSTYIWTEFRSAVMQAKF